jgi:hypothetical protein
MQVRLNTGLAAAVPAWKLAELLDVGPLAEFREKTEEALRLEDERDSGATKD